MRDSYYFIFNIFNMVTSICMISQHFMNSLYYKSMKYQQMSLWSETHHTSHISGSEAILAVTQTKTVQLPCNCLSYNFKQSTTALLSINIPTILPTSVTTEIAKSLSINFTNCTDTAVVQIWPWLKELFEDVSSAPFYLRRGLCARLLLPLGLLLLLGLLRVADGLHGSRRMPQDAVIPTVDRVWQRVPLTARPNAFWEIWGCHSLHSLLQVGNAQVQEFSIHALILTIRTINSKLSTYWVFYILQNILPYIL